MSSEKKFGLLFITILFILAFWSYNKNIIFFLISSFFLIFFLIITTLNLSMLKLFSNYWIKLGEFIGSIVAPLIMFITYFIFLTPISLIMKIFKKDILNLNFNNKVKSYWVIKNRNINSMDKQF